MSVRQRFTPVRPPILGGVVATLFAAGVGSLGLIGAPSLVGASADILPASASGGHIWVSGVLAQEHVLTAALYNTKTGRLSLGAVVTTIQHGPVKDVSVTFTAGNLTCSDTTGSLGAAGCVIKASPPQASFSVSAAGTASTAGITRQSAAVITFPVKVP